MEMTKRDYQELYNHSEVSSKLGERVRDWVDNKVGSLTKKTVMWVGFVVFGVGFFTLGFFMRKKGN